MGKTYDDPMTVRRVAVLAYHSSPLHEPGSGDAGGMTVYVRELASALAALGVHTDIFTRASTDEDRVTFLEDSVRVVPIEAGPRRELPKEELPSHLSTFVDAVKAFAQMQRIRYDLVHSHYWQSGVAAKDLVETWQVPLVHSPHTLGRVKNAWLPPGDVPEPESRLQGEQEVINAADVLIANTDAEYHDLACMYRAPHDALKVLSPGVNHVSFRPGDAAEARERLGLPQERPILLSAGRIQKLKGLDLAIRTVERLRSLVEPEPLLVIVGGPSGAGGAAELQRLQTLVDELDVGTSVRFVGPRPHGSLPDHYRAADVTLICSYSESFGLAALEAHACGCPVVGSPVGGLSHIVTQGSSGYLIDDRDPDVIAQRVAELVRDKELAASFSERAYRNSTSLSWEKAADVFLELYECLVNDRFPELCTC